MNTTFSDRSLGEATESLKVLESYQATKGEKLLKSFGVWQRCCDCLLRRVLIVVAKRRQCQQGRWQRRGWGLAERNGWPGVSCCEGPGQSFRREQQDFGRCAGGDWQGTPVHSKSVQLTC